MANRKGIAVAMAGLGLMITGCTVSGDTPATGAAAMVATGGMKMAAMASQEDIRRGQVLYTENCVSCHQEGGVGLPGLAPMITDKEFLSVASDEFLLGTIRDGRRDTTMPTFGDYLKDDDIKAVIAYLRTFSTLPSRAAEVAQDHASMGDPRLGRRWFAQVCAGCHGPNGEGYTGGGSGTAIGKQGFLGKASDGMIRSIVKTGRSNTPMRGFQGPEALASLSNQEIDDIISYLRVLQ